jgi:hypothetical protein
MEKSDECFVGAVDAAGTCSRASALAPGAAALAAEAAPAVAAAPTATSPPTDALGAGGLFPTCTRADRPLAATACFAAVSICRVNVNQSPVSAPSFPPS